MKKALKITAIILLVIAVLAGVLIFALSRLIKSALGDQWEDYAKLFTMQTGKDLPPLENVTQRREDIKFINKDGTVETRPIRLYLPEEAARPLPLVYVPHYEMAEDSAELRRYLAQGWAVASPTAFDNACNGELTDDDLVFNNAALYALRHMGEFDTQRIAIVGGSAGGYTALMLSALQMGNCVSIATAPISNVYFNFHQYFPQAESFSGSGGSAEAPFFLKLVTGMFLPIGENFPDKEDVERWEALSPVGLADCFNSPLAVVHVTSDILVPIDQTTREFTYDTEGGSMPEGFSTRLPLDNPGVLGHSLAEELPPELTHTEHIPITDPDADSILPYDGEKLFNLNIYDDGPTQASGSHRATAGTGIIDDVPYLKEMFSRSLAETEQLMPGKLRLLLERYRGGSVQLSAHEGIDDTVYGSLAVYRQEVTEELGQWAENHSLEELDAAVQEAVRGTDESTDLLEAWTQIRAELEKE